MEKGVLCLDGLPRNLTNQEIEAMIQAETGIKPIGVKRVGSCIKVTPAADDPRNCIKRVYDRQKLQGGNLSKYHQTRPTSVRRRSMIS